LSRRPTATDHATAPNDDLGQTAPVAAGPTADAGPLGWLPQLSARQLRLERWLAQWSPDNRLPLFLVWLETKIGSAITLERREVVWRASGLNRAGLIAQFTATRRATRLAIGIENALAHAVVDRLLGFDRPFAESRLQLTPVEWGIWTFLILRALEALDSWLATAGPEPPAGQGTPGTVPLVLDRAGPDPFDPSGLGSIVTLGWSARIGATAGAVRLWLPETLIPLALHYQAAPARTLERSAGPLRGAPALGARAKSARGELAGMWRAEAGVVPMPQGLKRLRAGGVLPVAAARLAGTPTSPTGPVDLVLDLDGQDGRFRIPTSPVPDSGGRFLRVEAPLVHDPKPRDPILVPVKEHRPMSQPSASSNPPSPAPEGAPLDVPVTLTVELGRVSLTLTRLADLKPGDVIELSRHSRAPVELTSGGRLVARGELILIDTDLGVRVTNVFL
jgi:flagellar motor switch protein FliN